MRYDEDRYHDEDDLWDDELELSTDDRRPAPDDELIYPNTSDSHYTPYHPPYDDPEENAHDDSQGVNEENDYYSEPEPDPEPTPRTAPSLRDRAMGLFSRKKKDDDDEEDEDDSAEEDDDNDNDYYDSDPNPRPRKRKPKTPKLDPEDPDYWISDEEDSPLTGIMPSSGNMWKWKAVAAVGAVILLIIAWVWFFLPYSDGAVKYGYIRNMERRGLAFKTFEGTLIPYKELGDPDPLYFQEIPFSVTSDSLATRMKRMMLGCVPVRVEYETYHTPLPWKGESHMVVVRADTADTRKILPPEFRPKL